VWGNWVQVTDGRSKYARGAVGENLPLSMWSNRWTTMPVHAKGFVELPPPDQRAWLDTMPGSDIPVIRQPYAVGDQVPMWALGGAAVDRHFLFDIDNDPSEVENRLGTKRETEMIELLRHALDSVEAPIEQHARLGL
jgi:hypothetical protein